MCNFKGVFLKIHWPFGTNTLRVEYTRGVILSHEVSFPSEFPMSCRLLVSPESISGTTNSKTAENSDDKDNHYSVYDYYNSSKLELKQKKNCHVIF